MTVPSTETQLFHEYFAGWMEVYKQGAVRPITFKKYLMTLRRIIELAPSLKINALDKRTYQTLINEYAYTHEKQTTLDFHNHLKSAILDAIDEGLLKYDPTRKVIIKGRTPTAKKPKFLSQFELQALLKNLTLPDKLNWDWFILLVSKTGLRFSEALALIPSDFDFAQHKIKITQTWNYKNPEGGFAETKNFSSKRTLTIDSILSKQFYNLVKHLPANEPIFVNGRVFNSTVNNRISVLCKKSGVPVITVHSLRHTHASLLIYAGVSIASVAKRLGHSSVTTTQETYLHIIQEMENQDNDKIVRHLSSLV